MLPTVTGPPVIYRRVVNHIKNLNPNSKAIEWHLKTGFFLVGVVIFYDEIYHFYMYREQSKSELNGCITFFETIES